MTEKAEGEAGLKVNKVKRGQGVEAFQRVHYWFTKTTGLALTDRMQLVMKPGPPKADEDLLGRIEA